MIQDEMLKDFLGGHLGMSEEDMAKIGTKQEEELKNVGEKAGKYRVVAEVLDIPAPPTGEGDGTSLGPLPLE